MRAGVRVPAGSSGGGPAGGGQAQLVSVRGRGEGAGWHLEAALPRAGCGLGPRGGCPPSLRPAFSAPCSSAATSGKKQAAKSKEELAQEKKKELERRLQDVSGQLNNKKPAKKGTCASATLLPRRGVPRRPLLLLARGEGRR